VLAQARRHPRQAVSALGAVVLLGATSAWALGPGSDTPHDNRAPNISNGSSSGARPDNSPATDAMGGDAIWEAPLRDGLNRGVAAADAKGGATQVGIWVDNSPRPVERGDQLGLGRLWSLSKPVSAIAAIDAANTRGESTPTLMTAVADAITKSDNCAQRQVVLDLQQRAGGIDAAQSAFDAVLKQAGVTLSTKPQRADIAGDPACRSYLSRNGTDIRDPFGTVLQLGTVEWTLPDALRFAHALADGTYGATGETVLELMRRPKERPAGSSPTDYTAPLNEPPSGGMFPRPWMPAYKGGWGGHSLNPPNFRAAEIVVLDVGAHRVAVAATFRPTVQPQSDDPGTTLAPQALGALFDSIEQTIVDLGRRG